MALAIDTKHLAEQWTSDHESHLDSIAGSTGRFQLYRVFAHATVIPVDIATIRRISEARSKPMSPAKKAALDSQADQENDLDELEVFHNLEQLAATTEFTARKDHRYRPLLTSAQCPTFAARSRGRPASSFHRYSVKISMLRSDNSEAYGYYLITHTDLLQVVPGVRSGSWSKWAYEPKIVWATGGTGSEKYFVVWHLQLDFVDLFSRSTDPNCRSGKRRRSLNPFHYVSEAKRTSGVRYRTDRRTWVAEMKTYKGKSKVQFGEFKSSAQAARAVDAAFFHYGKAKLLNFPDTSPQLLATKPVSVGLTEKEKLKLVKERAKWLASLTPAQIPAGSTPTSTPLSNAAVSGDSFGVPALGLRSFSEITSPYSCGYGSNEADDGISQPQPWILGDPDYYYSSSSATITFDCDPPRIEQPPDFQRMCMELFSKFSPPTLMGDRKRNRSGSPGDFSSRLWEQQSLGSC